MNLRVLKIIDGTTVDGPGFRTSIYLQDAVMSARGVTILRPGILKQEQT